MKTKEEIKKLAYELSLIDGSSNKQDQNRIKEIENIFQKEGLMDKEGTLSDVIDSKKQELIDVIMDEIA